MLERGRVAGSKNVFGGRVYSKPFEEIYPNLLKDAPIQRWVVKERFSMAAGDSILSLDYEAKEKKSFIRHLSELASWMVKQAEDAGSFLVTEIVVDGFVLKDGYVKGVRIGDEVVESGGLKESKKEIDIVKKSVAGEVINFRRFDGKGLTELK